MSQSVILTAAPGAVFLRQSAPVVEMTPAEALAIAAELRRRAQIALAASDGSALLSMLGAGPG